MFEHQAEVSSTRLTITSLCSSTNPHKRSFDSVHQDCRLEANHDTKAAERTSKTNRQSTLQQSPKSRGNVATQHKNSSNTSAELTESLPNSANKISLPSFRESFPFAVNETTNDYDQLHYLPIPPPPLRLQPSPESLIRPVFHFKAHHPEISSSVNYPLLSNELPFLRYQLGYGGTSSGASSAASSNGDWADSTCSIAYMSGFCSNRETSPSDIKVAFSSSGAYNFLSKPSNPPSEVPSVVQSFNMRTTVTQENFLPAVKRARTASCHSDESASCDDQHLSSPALSPAAWSCASPTLTSTTRRRSRTYARQDWQTYAIRGVDGSWRCVWAEDDYICTYKSKKQATKRHIELKHMKMKPHPCCYCGRTFGQRTTLDVHMATHTGRKDHVCQHYGCTERYSDASRLLRHRVAVHGYLVRKTAPKQLNCLGHKPTTRKKTRSRVKKL